MTNARLVVVAAFDKNDDGELVPAFDPISFETEGRAMKAATGLKGKHSGILAWSREVDSILANMDLQPLFSSLVKFRIWNDC